MENSIIQIVNSVYLLKKFSEVSWIKEILPSRIPIMEGLCIYMSGHVYTPDVNWDIYLIFNYHNLGSSKMFEEHTTQIG